MSDDDLFTFTVTNNTDTAIAELWASPDDEEWFQFSLDENIEPGTTTTIAWSEYTNDSPCEWWIQAVFDGGEESEARQFNFCEEPDLTIG